MKIFIAGYGIEGEASYNYFSKDPNNHITIGDQKTPSRVIPSGVKTIFGDDYLKNLDRYDLIMRTSGLDKNKIITKSKVWTVTNEMFAKCPAPIIGVTGTKGKGTTSSMIASIFEVAGEKVWLTGNIGVVSLDDLQKIKPTDFVIYELSSFQLWDIERSPHVSVVTLIEPEHLDVHVDFDDYVDAKANIRKFQKTGDICIYHPTNKKSSYVANASAKGLAIRYGVPDDGGVYVKNGYFCQGEHKICSLEALQLVGAHNVENACAAISVAKVYQITDKKIELGIRNFKGLPYRIEFIRDFNGVKYYNDSFSSSTPAVMAAIKSFSQDLVLILGGVDRGGDFTDIAKTIAKSVNIKAVIVIGEIKDKLTSILLDAKPSALIEKSNLTDMADIVNLASSYAKPGSVVVLSPGCGSFDMFKDFYDRGDKFNEAVKRL